MSFVHLKSDILGRKSVVKHHDRAVLHLQLGGGVGGLQGRMDSNSILWLLCLLLKRPTCTFVLFLFHLAECNKAVTLWVNYQSEPLSQWMCSEDKRGSTYEPAFFFPTTQFFSVLILCLKQLNSETSKHLKNSTNDRIITSRPSPRGGGAGGRNDRQACVELVNEQQSARTD